MGDNNSSEDEHGRYLSNVYRNLLYKAMQINEEGTPGRESVQHISNVMCKADELIKDVRSSDDAVIDARVISVSSNVLKRTAEAINTNLFSFTAEEYCSNIVSYLQEESCATQNNKLKWQKLASFAAKCFSRTPSYMYMFGSFQVGEVAPTQKKTRKQRDKQEEGSKKQPENVQQIEKQEDGIEETVQYIMNVLSAVYKRNASKPICYFKLVINPDSFGATIENIFHVAFLIKDGYIDLTWDKNKLPVIAPVPKDVVSTRKVSDQEKQQMILVMDMQEWDELKKKLKITETLLKPLQRHC